jgi:hypothetical protein
MESDPEWREIQDYIPSVGAVILSNVDGHAAGDIQRCPEPNALNEDSIVWRLFDMPRPEGEV